MWLHICRSLFPDDNWETKNYDEVGLDKSKIDNLFDLTFSDDATMSAVLIKDGYIIRTIC